MKRAGGLVMSNDKKMTQQEVDQKIKEYCERGHARPVSRRDFLRAGVISSSAWMMLPTGLDVLLSAGAQAAGLNCPSGSSSMPALVCINASGGACFAWDFLPVDSGGNLLPSYSKLGGGTAPGTVTSPFANKQLKISSIGTMVPAIQTQLGGNAASILGKTVLLPIASASQDDTGTDKNSISVAAINAGLSGKIALMGTQSSVSTGLNNVEAFGLKSVAPFRPSNVTAIVNSLSAGTTGVFGALSASKKAKIINTISSISNDEANRLANANGGTVATNLIGCANQQNTALATAPPAGDARQDSQMQTIWGITTATSTGNSSALQASMVLAALQGNSGPVGIDLGGYDYHGQGQANQNSQHQQLGQLIAQVLASASAKGKDIVIHVTTDGATDSTNSTTPAPPQGDSGSNGMNFMLFFRGSGTGTIPSATKPMVGYFNTSQQNDPKSPTNQITYGALAAFANYLQFAGQINLLPSIIPTSSGLMTDSTTLAALLGIA
jgi:hypothetical protein